MISIEELASKIRHRFTFREPGQDMESVLVKIIKQVQLDAWKQGMSDAINIVSKANSTLHATEKIQDEIEKSL